MITVQDLGNGYFSLTPEPGYILLNTRTQRTHSQAVVKDVRPFKATKL